MKGGQDPFMASTGIDWTAAEPACNTMDKRAMDRAQVYATGAVL